MTNSAQWGRLGEKTTQDHTTTPYHQGVLYEEEEKVYIAFLNNSLYGNYLKATTGSNKLIG